MVTLFGGALLLCATPILICPARHGPAPGRCGSTAPRRSFACVRSATPRWVRSNKVKIADDLGVAVPELEYVQAIGHDAWWAAQLRGVG